MNRGAVIGLVVFILLVVVAVFAPLHRAARSRRAVRDRVPAAAGLAEGGKPAFLLGTDAVGRDILSRLIYGARFSLLIGVVVVDHRADRRHRRSACSPAISAAGSIR